MKTTGSLFVRCGAAVAAVLIVHAIPSVAEAQCADGTLPPCSVPAARVIAASPVPSATDRARRFVVLPFRNVTRQADHDWLVEGSTTMLVESLSRWKGISVVPDEKLYPALKRAGVGIGTVVESPKVRRIAEETGGWTAITGEVISTGGRVRISARAWDVPTNRELVRATSEVAANGDLRLAFDTVSMRLLRSAGIDSVTPELLASTSQNVDAYRAYLRGLSHTRRSEIKSAVEAFETAVRADSGFALAYAELAKAQFSSGPLTVLTQPGSKAAANGARALALSSTLPPRNRQIVQATALSFRAQFTEARQILERLYAADSNDIDVLSLLIQFEQIDPHLHAVGGISRPRGSLARAIAMSKRAVLLDPGRTAIYGVLASTFANASRLQKRSDFVTEQSGSLQELLRMMIQPGNPVFYTVYSGDSVVLVPAASLSLIPQDSIRAGQRRARAAARAWVDQWIAVSAGEAAPYTMATELAAEDGDETAALRLVARAEELGAQNPMWSAAAWRLLLYSRDEEYAQASWLADSLTAAGFFKPLEYFAQYLSAARWAFGHHLIAGRMTAAGGMIEAHVGEVTTYNPECRTPTICLLRGLMGPDDPEDGARIPRAFRLQALDSVAARVRAYASAPTLGPLLSTLLVGLASASDQTQQPWSRVLAAAETLAVNAQEAKAFEIASNAVFANNALEPSLVAFPWYRRGVDALAAARLQILERMHPRTAVVAPDRAVFEWQVDDATPFPLNSPETPPGRQQYGWELSVRDDARELRFVLDVGLKDPSSVPSSSTLSALVSQTASRRIETARVTAAGTVTRAAVMAGRTFSTEVAPGKLRMVVTDSAMVAWLRTARPSTIRYRFYPCAAPVDKTLQCVNKTVPIEYK